MSHVSLASRLARTPSPLRAQLLAEHLVARLREALSLDAEGAVHARSRFAELGIDSRRALELKEDLEEQLGASLPTTLFFDYPTSERVAAHLVNTVLRFDNAPSHSEGAGHAATSSNARESETSIDAPTVDLDAQLRRTFDKYGL